MGQSCWAVVGTVCSFTGPMRAARNGSIYRVVKKTGTLFVRLYTSSNIDRFSNLCYCQNQENICNSTITKDPTIPQVCCYTTL